MLNLIIILLVLFMIPIQVCFRLTIENGFDYFLFFFFIADIIINMNTSYFNKGFIVKKRINIITHYVKNEFFIDTITLIFYFLDLKEFGHFRLLKMLFFLRWKKIEKIHSKIQEKFTSLNSHNSFIDLINLMFFSFYILNIFACFWYYIATIDHSNSNTWLKVKLLEDEPLINKYIYSFYWSTVTIMTVGYGDISATNITETIYSTFTVFFGCGLFAYFINSIGNIVQDINKEAHIFR